MKKSFSIKYTGMMIILLISIAGCTANPNTALPVLPTIPASPTDTQFVYHLPDVVNLASPEANAYPAPGTATPTTGVRQFSGGGSIVDLTPIPPAPSLEAGANPNQPLDPITGAVLPTPTPTKKPTPTQFYPTPVPLPTTTPYARPASDHGENLPPEKWQNWPVIPVISARARQIYQAGLKAGNDPTRFSKVGDCQNIRQYFLGIYDDPNSFRLGKQYDYLQGTIDHFQGSWHRLSEAVRSGFNVASVLTPLYANPADCKPGEDPLACEVRLWHPSIMIISMETWTPGRPTTTYEGYLRQIVDYAIAHNILPILATKADNLEGDNSINLAVARVAAAYDIPLWNFWRAVQGLPNKGLTADHFHLTNAANQFDNMPAMQNAWPVRNLTALQVIDTVWKAVR